MLAAAVGADLAQPATPAAFRIDRSVIEIDVAGERIRLGAGVVAEVDRAEHSALLTEITTLLSSVVAGGKIVSGTLYVLSGDRFVEAGI